MANKMQYAMNLYEFDSFVTKFKFLTKAGFQASLTIESLNHGVSLCMQVELGTLNVLPCDFT